MANAYHKEGLLRVSLASSLLLFLLLPVASAHAICFGSNCYQSQSVPLRLEELIIDAKLNLDESVDFTETLGLVYNSTAVQADIKSLVLPDFYLPQGSEVYPDIKVTDLIAGKELTRVYFFDENCTDKFIYHEDENAVQLCIQPEDQMRIQIEAIVLSTDDMQEQEWDREKDNNLSNPLTLVLPPNDYSYFASMKIEGGEGVVIQDINGIVCKDSNAEAAGASDLKLIPIANGILCQGDIQPSNGKSVTTVLAVQGINEKSILQKQQDELNTMQKESINASIRSSDAAISLSNSTSMTVLLTIVIALFTGASVYVTMINLRESKKTSKPIIKVKLDPMGTDKVVLKVVNIGKSSAMDVNVEYNVLPNGGTHSWHHHLVQENDAIRIVPRGFKDLSLSKFLSTYDKIAISCSWADPHGTKQTDSYEIRLKDYKHSLEHNLSV